MSNNILQIRGNGKNNILQIRGNGKNYILQIRSGGVDKFKNHFWEALCYQTDYGVQLMNEENIRDAQSSLFVLLGVAGRGRRKKIRGVAGGRGTEEKYFRAKQGGAGSKILGAGQKHCKPIS